MKNNFIFIICFSIFNMINIKNYNDHDDIYNLSNSKAKKVVRLQMKLHNTLQHINTIKNNNDSDFHKNISIKKLIEEYYYYALKLFPEKAVEESPEMNERQINEMNKYARRSCIEDVFMKQFVMNDLSYLNKKDIEDILNKLRESTVSKLRNHKEIAFLEKILQNSNNI